MSALAIKNAILSSNSRCFTVTFLKLDGTIRTMLAKVGVQRYKGKNKKRPYKASKSCIRVFDMESKSYKSLTIKNLLSYRCGSVIINRNWIGYYNKEVSNKRGVVELKAIVVENYVAAHTYKLLGVLNDDLEKDVIKVQNQSNNFVEKVFRGC